MAEGVGGLGRGYRKLERHAVPLLDDGHEDAVSLRAQSRVMVIPSLVR